jgi:Cdc6-like AAA superfamily ATPase
LIGITNQLDLTDRSLSRLQTKCELKPKLVHFPPCESGVLDLIPSVAIQLLAAKVSAVSGDINDMEESFPNQQKILITTILLIIKYTQKVGNWWI